MLTNTLPPLRPLKVLRASAWLALSIIAFGCQGPTQVISTDLTRVSGVYLIAYVDRPDIRLRLEDQFVAELSERTLRAVPSHPDLPEIKRATVAHMVAAANRHDVAVVGASLSGAPSQKFVQVATTTTLAASDSNT